MFHQNRNTTADDAAMQAVLRCMKCNTCKRTTTLNFTSVSGAIINWSSSATMMHARHSRERISIMNGPQQRHCHGHPLHSSIIVAVEMRMEGVEMLLLVGTFCPRMAADGFIILINLRMGILRILLKFKLAGARKQGAPAGAGRRRM